MVYSEYTKKQILIHSSEGLSVGEIVRALKNESITSSQSGVWKFLKKYKDSGEVKQKCGSGRREKLMKEYKRLLIMH